MKARIVFAVVYSLSDHGLECSEYLGTAHVGLSLFVGSTPYAKTGSNKTSGSGRTFTLNFIALPKQKGNTPSTPPF